MAKSLVEICGRVQHDKGLRDSLSRVDLQLLDTYRAVMERTFLEVFRLEKEKKVSHLSFMKDVYFTAAEGAMRHIDETGVTAGLGALVDELEDFSFEDNAVCLAFDHNYLVKVLGVPDEKVVRLWPFVDERKKILIKRMAEQGFRLETLVEPAKELFDASGGEEWQRLSPGFWTRMGGFALGCANVGLAVGTASVGTPVAVASVMTGAAAVGAG